MDRACQMARGFSLRRTRSLQIPPGLGGCWEGRRVLTRPRVAAGWGLFAPAGGLGLRGKESGSSKRAVRVGVDRVPAAARGGGPWRPAGAPGGPGGSGRHSGCRPGTLSKLPGRNPGALRSQCGPGCPQGIVMDELSHARIFESRRTLRDQHQTPRKTTTMGRAQAAELTRGATDLERPLLSCV